jgi:prolyl oligopeptidase
MPTSIDRRAFGSLLTGFAASLVFPESALARAAKPLRARLQPFTEVLWGERVVDPYRWMENPADRDWLPFMRSQAAHARARLDALPARRRLLSRVAALSGETTQVVYPRPAGDRVFFEKRAPGQARFSLTVRMADGSERVLVDPSKLAPATQSATIDWWMPSPDGSYLAFGYSIGGSEASAGHVVEVATGRLLPDTLAHVPYASPSWLPDGSGFFYNRFAGRASDDPAYYNDRSAWLHRLGTDQAADLRVMASGMHASVTMSAISSPEIQVGVGSDQVALVMRDGYVRTFALYLADRADVRRVCGADEGVADFGLSGADLFLVSTAQSPRGQLLRTAAAAGTLADAKLVMSAGEPVLDEINASADGVYVTLNNGGEQSLVHARADGSLRVIGLPFTGWIQSVAVAPTTDTDTDTATAAGRAATLVRITSWLQPAQVFAIDGKTGQATRSDLQPASPIDLSPYESRRIFATVRDGTRVPISIVARKDRRGPSPCLVHVYGAYQWPSQPVFDARAMAFLEAGGMIATAHVRGGGEYGRAWHEAGWKASKPNTWRDLIDCCEALIAQGWTAKRRIAVMGGSAGGIAVGRAMTERPDLFGAVISKVGMSNPLRAEFEPNGQPNVPEFGSVKSREGFLALRAMDSFHAVKDGVRYPPLLLTTGLNDARVAPHNAAKMAARLQNTAPGSEVLLRVEFEGGHMMNGIAKDKADAEYADDFAFVLAHTTGRR